MMNYSASLGHAEGVRSARPRELTVLPSPESLIAQLKVQGITLPPGPVHADGYGDSPQLSESLLKLIRVGRKRAGTGLLWAYEHDGEHIANAGNIEIAIDHLHRPAIVTRMMSSVVVPFCEVAAEYAAVEGEGDGSLEYWRKAHWAFFYPRVPSDRASAF